MADKSIAAQVLKQIKQDKNGPVYAIGSDGEKLLATIKYWVSTGCWPLDMVISGGRGVPGGRIIEIYGAEQTGKSLLALYIMAQVQQVGGIALMIDTEGTNTQEFMEAMGVNTEEIIVVSPDTVEEVERAMRDFIGAKAAIEAKVGDIVPAVIVWDSIAATSTEVELETVRDKGLGKATMALHARQMSKMLRILPHYISENSICGVFVNQTRSKIGVMFGDQETTVGGRALKFHTSLRLRLEVLRGYKGSEDDVGFEARATAVKNKVGNMFGQCRFPILERGGIDNAMACLWYLEDSGLIDKNYSWLTITLGGEEHKFQKGDWPELFTKHSEEVRRLVTEDIQLLRTQEIEEEHEETDE